MGSAFKASLIAGAAEEKSTACSASDHCSRFDLWKAAVGMDVRFESG